MIHLCRADELDRVHAVINAGASAYRGVIPSDCWHEPYMEIPELQREVDQGVVFWGSYEDDVLVGVMGLQAVQDVALIRHAYLEPRFQRTGLGSALLDRLRTEMECPFLVGTWRAAHWAVRFYKGRGFTLTDESEKDRLLQRYWTVPPRQAEESVVLADLRGQEK